MKKLISQVIGGWHHGKGSKNSRKGNYDLALKHFQAALKYAMQSNNEASLPLEMECIARTYVRLGNYEQAQKYAQDSLSKYKKFQKTGNIFEACVGRVTELLRIIEKRGQLGIVDAHSA